MKKKFCISYFKIFCIIIIGLSNISKSLAQDEIYGNYADTLAAVPAFQRMAIEWIEKGKAVISDAYKEKFEQVAWLVIKDKNEMTQIGVTNIARENNCLQWEVLLSMVGSGFLKDATKIIEETRTANEQVRKEIEQLTGEKERISEETKRKLPENEQLIMSLKIKYKDRSAEWIKSNFGEGIQGSVDAFIHYNYACKQETINWLKELGIPIEGLKVKDGK